MEICSLLEKENFIKSVARRGKKSKMIEVTLFYNGKFPRVRGVKRISKSSRRIYKKVSDLHPVKNGYGVLVVSTPKGILTDKEARKQKVGGEAMFEIW
jgi:small subunit ribosomal protein S8